MIPDLALAASALGMGGALALAASERRTREARLLGVRRACHELRGPITAVRLGVQLAARTGELSADRLRALDLELGRAGLALEDLLAYDEPPSSRRCERLDMRALAAQSVLAWSATAELHGATLRLDWPDRPVVVSGERIRLAQVLGNLIANAIEHGGGEVVVAGTVAGGRLGLEVRDHGPGLPAGVRAALSPGEALRSRRRMGRGCGPPPARRDRCQGDRPDARRGHGLAIAAEIVAAHHGSLTVAPAEHGARLVVTLPLAG